MLASCSRSTCSVGATGPARPATYACHPARNHQDGVRRRDRSGVRGYSGQGAYWELAEGLAKNTQAIYSENSRASDPIVVAKAIRKAVVSAKPKPRYPVGYGPPAACPQPLPADPRLRSDLRRVRPVERRGCRPDRRPASTDTCVDDRKYGRSNANTATQPPRSRNRQPSLLLRYFRSGSAVGSTHCDADAEPLARLLDLDV